MQHLRIFLTVLILTCIVVPTNVSAASLKPSCSLAVSTTRGKIEVSSKASQVLSRKGEPVTIAWASRNSKKATDGEGDTIALSGSETFTPSKTTTYTYKFADGSKKAQCAVTVHIMDGSIDAPSSTNQKKPTISGKVSGTKSVFVVVSNAAGKVAFSSKEIKVKSGKWKTKVTKSLPTGSYTVTLFGAKDVKLNTIATSTMNVLPKGSSTGGSLSVSQLPLLMGGNATSGASVPVAYVKIANPGKTATAIEGIYLLENGSASDDVVIGFATNDDKGGSRTTIGGTEGTKQFKNGSAFVPLIATIEPGQIRIFTIKAILSRNSQSGFGKQLKIDVGAVKTKATTKGSFPLRGTTFTLMY